MPIQVNPSCVDWPFYFWLSKPLGKENKIFPVCYAEKFWYYKAVKNRPHLNLAEERYAMPFSSREKCICAMVNS